MELVFLSPRLLAVLFFFNGHRCSCEKASTPATSCARKLRVPSRLGGSSHKKYVDLKRSGSRQWLTSQSGVAILVATTTAHSLGDLPIQGAG
ncbi:uncharacterized protein BCR38DRAFT_70169 [Pseudomassariella vexata]|uniref:Secreted protein n=1 Tax=Pseudomassariella vexata TaxID=1141098 RepID=A0A1Y2DHS8_9PEZI|nr:uncharacterized protein BCR38DRAFT_70169 [Pseudomassariella vexata]ORY58798.1 hypothetical protein BCR38DRAFT_70169 [Pseudomassariella vexata]